jgi:hypothetical protein
MKEFLESAYDENSHSRHGIDWMDPAELAQAAEEQDEEGTIDLAGVNAIPPDALLTLLRFIISPAVQCRSRKQRWKTSQLRLVVLAHAAGLDDVAEMSLTQLASELGVTRSLMSWYAIRMTDELKQSQVRGGKSRASREVYRQTAIRSHIERGHRVKVLQAQEPDDDA